IEGDVKKIASALKKRNKSEASGQRTLSFVGNQLDEPAHVANAMAALEAAPAADASALAKKELQWESILDSHAYRHQRLVADAWCAAFVWPKREGASADAAPTNELWRRIRNGEDQPPVLAVQTTEQLAKQYQFFHWHLAFPHVFERG